MSNPYGPLYVLLLGFLIVLAILWVLLPFAVFGTKDLIRELIEQNKTATQAIKDLTNQLQNNNSIDKPL
jgi:predicted PurR-regulated permease PerM